MGLFNRHHHTWETISFSNIRKVDTYLSEIGYYQDKTRNIDGTYAERAIMKDETCFVQECTGCHKLRNHWVDGKQELIK